VELGVGEVFASRYVIEGSLGRGGMGHVYRARDRSLDEVVALKTLGVESTPASTARFRNEVKLARRVTHRNVARVFDLGEHEGNLYLTMEYVEGTTLRDLMRKGRLPIARVVRVALDLCAGLSAAHASGVVHRDLKPTNVLVETASGRVVMVDFGIAHAIGEESGLTVGAIGTPRYMAPEQASVGKIDERTDLFALGLIILELATGAPVDPRAPEPYRAPLPALAQEILARCLRRERADRPASADEVAQVLAGIDLVAPPVPPTMRFLRADEANEAEAPTVARVAGARTSVSRTTSTRTLAVLPFRYRGPADRDYLGEVLAEELVDALSRVRALRVLGTGATARFRVERDPRTIAAELGAYAIIDGTVQLVGEGESRTLRLNVRLLDAEGAQIHSERFDGLFQDALSIGDSIAARLAEQLRLELTVFGSRSDTPPEAVDLYLSGRRRARWGAYSTRTTALDELQRALALAPSFGPALAAYAVACTRAHWIRDPKTWIPETKKAVATALELAPDLVDTRFAAANLALQLGDYSTAYQELERALDLAPTFAEAHEYLGQLLLEAGAIERGLHHARTADALDPMHSLAILAMTRHHALHGEWQECDRLFQEIARRGNAETFPVILNRIRISAWRGTMPIIRGLVEAIEPEARRLGNLQPALFAHVLLGEVPLEHCLRVYDTTPMPMSERMQTIRHQMKAEIMMHYGERQRALEAVVDASNTALIDVEWLDHSPLLALLRGSAEWTEARRKARLRATPLFTGA
jgi:eukaryotic-like serine/threonine-protein kinase